MFIMLKIPFWVRQGYTIRGKSGRGKYVEVVYQMILNLFATTETVTTATSPALPTRGAAVLHSLFRNLF